MNNVHYNIRIVNQMLIHFFRKSVLHLLTHFTSVLLLSAQPQDCCFLLAWRYEYSIRQASKPLGLRRRIKINTVISTTCTVLKLTSSGLFQVPLICDGQEGTRCLATY